MRAYSSDLRERVLKDSDQGLTTLQVAQKYAVSTAWVRRVKQRRREHGEVAPRPRGGARRRTIDRERLAALVQEQPDATLAERCVQLGVTCSISGVWKALRALKVTYKKSRTSQPSRIVPTWPWRVPSGG